MNNSSTVHNLNNKYTSSRGRCIDTTPQVLPTNLAVVVNTQMTFGLFKPTDTLIS